MILPGKNVLYDWNGGNEWLFRQINGIHGGNTYNSVMLFLTQIGDHHNFPYYMAGLFAWALLTLAIRKTAHKGGTKQYLIAWVGVFLVLGASYGADGLAVKGLKEEFHYSRPYAALPEADVQLLDKRKEGDETHSFPSGHASFITVMVLGLWPMLSLNMCLTGLVLIASVCWSRIAIGMHFPADVLAGFFLSLLVVWIMRTIIYGLMRKLFGLRC